MRNILLKRWFVFVIFILFVGAAVVPSITGNIEKIGIQSKRKAPIRIHWDNDYLNAYWKFDECYGDSVGDSSKHTYGGIRNGATWTSDGCSGCALIFDGVDDFVDLSSYSKELGVNKTDDIILSFYFKSTSGGLIYSATAPWGYNPEFRIELLSNGSLLFYLITQLCGIILYSNGAYNDGDWHYAEYYFNGITSNPILTLYVDHNFDTSITHWLCEIENVDFAKTKIGMHAYQSTDYFDGYIDEFEFIKYEQGNKQAPPIINGPTVGKANVEYDYSFITNDPEGDNISLYINWDDDKPDEWIGPYKSGDEIIASHKWEDEGEYKITAMSKDIWHQSCWSDKYVIKIGNQPPDTPAISGQKYGDPQQQLTYTFVAYDYENDNVKYLINWDDDSTTETDYYPSDTPAIITHSWEIKNDYYITAKAIDTQNKEGEWSEPYHIRIGDKPPNKPDIYGPSKCVPKIQYDYDFTSIDPENDNISYDIDWGDGDIEKDIGPLPSGTKLSLSHSWNISDTYIIRAQAKDEFDYYGNWSELKVTIPRNKAFNLNLIEFLYERFPCLFPIIRQLLKLK